MTSSHSGDVIVFAHSDWSVRSRGPRSNSVSWSHVNVGCVSWLITCFPASLPTHWKVNLLTLAAADAATPMSDIYQVRCEKTMTKYRMTATITTNILCKYSATDFRNYMSFPRPLLYSKLTSPSPGEGKMTKTCCGLFNEHSAFGEDAGTRGHTGYQLAAGFCL